MGPPDDFQPTPTPAFSSHARDRGLRRSRRATLWIAVTAAAGAGALGGFYTHLLPDGSAAPAPADAPAQSPAAPGTATAGKDDEEREEPNGYEDDEDNEEDEDDEDDEEGAAQVTQPAPQPPAQPPAATQRQPHTTTGAS